MSEKSQINEYSDRNPCKTVGQKITTIYNFVC